MDVVTRPNSAAVRRRSGSRSYAKSEEEDEAQSDNDDESSQSSARSSGDESAESLQDEARPSVPSRRVVLGPRTPNPQAVRHSSRRAAQKPSGLYSRKYHPQDYGVPGFQHKAIVIEDDQHDENEVPIGEPRKRKAAFSDMEQQSSDRVETAATQQAPRRPHKKLKSLSDARPAHTKKKRIRPSKASSKVKQRRSSRDIEDLVETAIQGSQAPAPVVISSGGESSDESGNQDAAHHRTAADKSDDASSGDQVDVPRHLLEACTSNMPETDYSGDRDDLNGSSLVNTSTTFAGETGTPATSPSHAQETMGSLARLPTYLRDRIALELRPRASVTATAVLRLLFDESHAGTAKDLVVQKPYLHYPSQLPISPSQPSSKADSEDHNEGEGVHRDQCKIIDIGDEDAEDVAAIDAFRSFNDPHETHTPLENQFEEQLAVTESSQYPRLADESDGLADSDPINLLGPDEDIPALAMPEEATAMESGMTATAADAGHSDSDSDSSSNSGYES